MGNSFFFKVAGIPVKILTETGKIRTEFYSRFGAFLISNGESTAVIKVSCKKNINCGRVIGKEWPLSIHYGNDIFIESLGMKGRFDVGGSGEVAYECGYPELLENFFRVLFAFLLVENNGVLLHSAGVDYNGSGIIFVGQSGSGKTTIASLLRDKATVYSDDIVAIRRDKNNYKLFSTPFRGEESLWLPEVRSVKLARVYIPQKANKTFSIIAKKGEALSKIIANSPFIYGFKTGLTYLFDFLEELIKQVPIYKLYFEKDAPIWEVIF